MPSFAARARAKQKVYGESASDLRHRDRLCGRQKTTGTVVETAAAASKTYMMAKEGKPKTSQDFLELGFSCPRISCPSRLLFLLLYVPASSRCGAELN